MPDLGDEAGVAKRSASTRIHLEASMPAAPAASDATLETLSGTIAKRTSSDKDTIATMSSAVRSIIESIGENPDREGIQRTPLRYAKAMMHFTEGYAKQLKDIVNEAVFEENHSEMVVVKDIDIFSLLSLIQSDAADDPD